MAPIDHGNEGQDPARLAEARTQLVSAAQWLARIERSYAGDGGGEPLRLRWSKDRDAIATHSFADDIVLELRIDGLVMQFTENGQPSDHEIDVEERSPAHVEAWILIELLHRGVDRDRFSKDLPYDTSALLSGDGVEFSPAQYGAELRSLAAQFAGAVKIVSQVADDGGVSISPRDLNVEANSGGRVIGFSLGGAEAGEPHFFVRRESQPDAVLPATSGDGATSEADIVAFLTSGGEPTRH